MGIPIHFAAEIGLLAVPNFSFTAKPQSCRDGTSSILLFYVLCVSVKLVFGIAAKSKNARISVLDTRQTLRAFALILAPDSFRQISELPGGIKTALDLAEHFGVRDKRLIDDHPEV